jgi:hypothetical protein
VIVQDLRFPEKLLFSIPKYGSERFKGRRKPDFSAWYRRRDGGSEFLYKLADKKLTLLSQKRSKGTEISFKS